MKKFSVLLGATLSLPVLADGNTKIETITVVGRDVNLIGSSISASQGVVGQKEIEVRPLSRTGEILELVPGMIATQHSGSGKAHQYFLRGFSLDHGTDFATFVDGMPVNMRSHGHGQGYSDINFVIPEAISTLVYKKGAYYADVGDFSGAGSASIHTASKLEHGTAELTAGENSYYRALLMNSFQAGNGEALFALESNFYQGPWTDIDEDVEKLNALAKYTTRLDAGLLTFNFMAYDNSWNSADQIPARAVEQGIIDRYGSIDKTLGGETNRTSFSVNFQGDNLKASAYVIDYGLNLWSNFTYFLDDADLGDQFEQVDERLIYGGQVSYDFDGAFNNKPMSNIVGVQLRVDDIDEVGLYRTQERNRLGTVRSDSIMQSSTSLFWDNQIDWTDSFSTVLGVRYDYFDFDVRDLVGTNVHGHDLSDNSGSNNDDIVSIKGSLIYDLTDQWQGYLSFGEGFHSNDARGTTIHVDPASGEAVEQVDALVESFGYELGLRGFIGAKMNTSIALWTLDLDSELLFVGDAGNTEPSGASKRKGLEATMYYRFNTSWSLDAEYAYTDAEYSDVAASEKYIPGTVKHVVQAGLNYDQGYTWFGSLRVRYFGERPLVENNSVTADSSIVWNMRAGYRLNDWTIKADLLNITDSKDHDIAYYYESKVANEAEAVEDIHYHTFEPRSIRLTATYVF